LARHEGDLRASAQPPLTLDELLTMLDQGGPALDADRHLAIARYLSASEGWAEAARMLGGAFAEGATELRERKAD
jgi:hypothetical protein